MTHCGDEVESAAECVSAASELGLLLQRNVTVLDDHSQPAGCFFVEEELRLYYNRKGASAKHFSFAKSLCHWRNASGFVLPKAVTTTITACSETHTVDVYNVSVHSLDDMLKELHRMSLRDPTRKMKFAIQIGPGKATLTQQVIEQSVAIER